MSSTSYFERLAERDLESRGVFRQAVFKCPECGGRSDRGTTTTGAAGERLTN